MINNFFEQTDVLITPENIGDENNTHTSQLRPSIVDTKNHLKEYLDISFGCAIWLLLAWNF